jgi:uncharacterized protein YbjQ (UPF0145 family)
MSQQGVTLSSTLDVAGAEIVEQLGLARGIAVRSFNIFQFFVLMPRIIFGGRIGALRRLSDKARQEALDELIQQASEMGADAVVGVRFDSSPLGAGMTEVLVYGTAVRLRR